MTATTLLFIHGRAQASTPEIAQDRDRLTAFVEAKKREWLGGLARGLLQAGIEPVTNAIFPFYGNTFQRRIREYEAAGGRSPELELGALPGERARELQEEKLLETKSAALTDLLRHLKFDPVRELRYVEPQLAERAAREGVQVEELGWDDLLRIPVLRAGLQFLGRKTGVPAFVIEGFLTDVAYYLELQNMRETVLNLVEESLRKALPQGGSVVVVGHSLGSVVAYDLLIRLGRGIEVQLFVTAGSPLGFPIVEKNLLGKQAGERPRVPSAVPLKAGGWINAFDVRDVVALLHPIAPDYIPATERQLVDEQTFNVSDPHSIVDYLSDPDIAGPIGRVLRE
jgi:hypothetical protein